MHPHRILSLLFLLLLSLALGACASHDARPAPEPGAPLPAVTLERGDRVFIKIENGKSMTEDLHSMLTAYLQSERGLNPASDVKEADLVISFLPGPRRPPGYFHLGVQQIHHPSLPLQSEPLFPLHPG